MKFILLYLIINIIWILIIRYYPNDISKKVATFVYWLTYILLSTACYFMYPRKIAITIIIVFTIYKIIKFVGFTSNFYKGYAVIKKKR